MTLINSATTFEEKTGYGSNPREKTVSGSVPRKRTGSGPYPIFTYKKNIELSLFLHIYRREPILGCSISLLALWSRVWVSTRRAPPGGRRSRARMGRLRPKERAVGVRRRSRLSLLPLSRYLPQRRCLSQRRMSRAWRAPTRRTLHQQLPGPTEAAFDAIEVRLLCELARCCCLVRWSPTVAPRRSGVSKVVCRVPTGVRFGQGNGFCQRSGATVVTIWCVMRCVMILRRRVGRGGPAL